MDSFRYKIIREIQLKNNDFFVLIYGFIIIKNGLRENGIVCLVINSNVNEINLNTSEIIDAQFEVNLSTERLQGYLNEVFSGWSLLKTSIVEQEYNIPREMFVSHLHTNVVTYVVRKC